MPDPTDHAEVPDPGRVVRAVLRRATADRAAAHLLSTTRILLLGVGLDAAAPTPEHLHGLVVWLLALPVGWQFLHAQRHSALRASGS